MSESLPLTWSRYSDKCIVVRGDTRKHLDHLKALGGKWNAHLKDGGGGGWIFPSYKEEFVVDMVHKANNKIPSMKVSTSIEQKIESPVKDNTSLHLIGAAYNVSTLNLSQMNVSMTVPKPIVTDIEQIVSYRLKIPKIGQEMSIEFFYDNEDPETTLFEVTDITRNEDNVVEIIHVMTKDTGSKCKLVNTNGEWKLDNANFAGHRVTF